MNQIFWLTLLGLLVVPACSVSQHTQLQSEKAKNLAALEKIERLNSGCRLYHLSYGEFPVSLDDLHKRPAQVKKSQWGGPYFDDPATPIDPWGRPFTYTPDEGNMRVTISSKGADGKQGTPDDISNAGSDG